MSACVEWKQRRHASPVYSANVKKWSKAFGEKKRHYVEVVVKKLSVEDLEKIEKKLKDYDDDTQKGGEFIKILKNTDATSKKDLDMENVKRNYEKLGYLKWWREWEYRFEKHCERKWNEKKNLYEEVFVESGECAYDKARPSRQQRRKNKPSVR